MIITREKNGLASDCAIVVDVGKTLSKVTLWSLGGRLLDRQVRPNEVLVVGGLRRLDAEGIGAWLRPALAKYRGQPVTHIIPVAHGAGVAVLDGDQLAFTPLDYEQAVPWDVLDAYRAERDPFSVTGSPALPDGLNIGSQLAWLDRLYPAAMQRGMLLPWAQYWAWFLSGAAVSEVTSLACHSDLWNPDLGGFSSLAQRTGWAARFAPMARAQDEVGALRPDLAEATGLPANVRVLAGLHDSNAALLAARGFAEFVGKEVTTLSTGTWFIAMRTPANTTHTCDLAQNRDCLVNVDPYGWRVPSARFMGGREIESVVEIDTRRVDIKPDQPALLAAVPRVLEAGAMLLPTLAPGCGPFPNASAQWLARPDDWYELRAATCLYAALVADTTLDLIGSEERLLVEGRFAEAEVFVRAIARLRPDMAVYTANAHNDVSFGALRLLDPRLEPQGGLTLVEPLDANLETYRSRWHAEIGIPAWS
ncbi:MAG: carbohydrate kinase [Novosphingobium sp.]